MICSKCGNELLQNTNICSNCGTVHQITPFEQPVMQQPIMQQPQNVLSGTDIWGEQYDEPQYLDDYSSVYVESDEKLLGTLGNGYLINILRRKVKKCHALLTDRRVYLQGVFFEGSGRKLNKVRSEKIVEVEDITGTGFVYTKGFGIMLSIITLIIGTCIGLLISEAIYVPNINFTIIGFCLALIVDIVCYFLSRKAFFIIEYAGGSISFNASIVGIADVRDFQKQIHRAKNKAKGK